jgi:cytochrome c peroxidase
MRRPPITAHDQGRLTAEQLRGEEIFVGKGGCIACHGGPLFTDNLIHDTDVPQLPGANDPGAARPPGGFNTPQMRDLRNTAPYMHNGVFKSIEVVVEFYNANEITGGPLRLTPEEKTELVEYLKAL